MASFIGQVEMPWLTCLLPWLRRPMFLIWSNFSRRAIVNKRKFCIFSRDVRDIHVSTLTFLVEKSLTSSQSLLG